MGETTRTPGSMKKIVKSTVLALAVVVVLVGVSWAWLQRGVAPPADAMQEAPCASNSRNQKSLTKCSELAGLEIPTVSFCELLKNEVSYKNKIVRTQAKLYADSGNFGLGDASCPGANAGARVDFDSTYGIAAEAQKAFDDLLCLPGRYYANKEADVVVVGRVDGFDEKPGDAHRIFQFTVMCVQRAENQRLTHGGT